jgi:hypothetical protein
MRGANSRSKKPATPPALSQVVPIFTRHVSPVGVTVKLVTSEDFWSLSVMTRPGSGSATRMRNSRVRGPALTLKRCRVPAPTPPSSTSKSEKPSGRKRWWCWSSAMRR